jgi:indole-3-glycerol phosphate synthase/phosphoribosylanthranilate isomerase
MSILSTIVTQRRTRIDRAGHSMGVDLPAARRVPVVPFGRDPFLVCEVKRRSPSRGDIAPGRDAREQARGYVERNVRSISVLTEEDNFGGSLTDLLQIKETFPGVSVLRKDFLLDVEDVEVSWRAGADAVLLIASILDAGTLGDMYRRARGLGLEALVEVHSDQDVAKCRAFAPTLTGINCRDLSTFSVDLLHPLTLRPRVDWETRLLFESGIRSPEDVRLALSAGFNGVLVGETAMKTAEALPGLLSAFGQSCGDFWARLCRRLRPGRPLVKICGITRRADAEEALSLGADALGFVFAESKRRASLGLMRELRDLAAIKVAVVATGTEGNGQGTAADEPPELQALIGEGLVDAVQFHGQEQPDQCAAIAFPYYKAIRVKGAADIEAMARYRCPRVLADAYSPQAAGGTGQRIPEGLVRELGSGRPLWLAGGLGADNVGAVVRELSPELIDASSRLEESPGKKDREKLRVFFREIEKNAKV